MLAKCYVSCSTPGMEALVSCGMMEVLLKVTNWYLEGQDNITVCVFCCSRASFVMQLNMLCMCAIYITVYFYVLHPGRDLHDLHDVDFLPCRACFSTTVLENCGRGKSFWITTCLTTVFEGKRGYAQYLYMVYFLVSV